MQKTKEQNVSNKMNTNQKRTVGAGLASTQGITLIALVITIIVLLILASIAINLTLGDNGIFTKAQEAREETRATTVEEQKNLWEITKALDNNTETKDAESLDALLTRLVKEGSLKQKEKEEIKATGETTIGKRTIVFGKDAKTLVQAFKDGEIKVGDYLDYDDVSIATEANKAELLSNKTGVEGTQTYSVDSSTNWRVLGLSEDGTQLQLISGSPIKKDGNEEDPYLHLKGAESYVYCEEVLNAAAGIYKNEKYATEARSMKMEDILRALEITVDKENNKAYKTGDSTQTELTYFGFFGQKYPYQTEDYSPESYLGLETRKAEAEGSAYMIPYTESIIVAQSSVLYEMLFKGTTEAENFAKSYWLASPGVGIGDGAVDFGPGAVFYEGLAYAGLGLFRSTGDCYEGRLAVRPVVSLKSNITVEDIKITTSSESDWTTTGGFVIN